MANSNLSQAKKAKNDEFYTQLSDIENELRHYRKHFEGKTILCNCDDPFESNFFKYFALNFEFLKLKKLIAVAYADSPIVKTRLCNDGHGYAAEMTFAADVNGDTAFDWTDIMEMFHNGSIKITDLVGKGDFRDEECLKLLDEADIVVTNPPFSLFREYVATLVEHEKKFIIWGNMNAVTYKEIFPLLKNNEMWLGFIANKTCTFRLPDSYTRWDEKATAKANDGYHYGNVPSITTFTNLDISKRHENLILFKRYREDPSFYPKYDNYDAINVDKVKYIPEDYDGVMGVPITFLCDYNPEQFEIVSFRKGEDGKDLVFTREREREREFNRTFVSLYDVDSRDDKERRRKDKWEAYLRENNDTTQTIEPIDYFFPRRINFSGNDRTHLYGTNGKYTYGRIFIRNLHPLTPKSSN